FLLSDFELLRQELNGLHVIEKTNVKRSILVTSHYSNLVIRELAIKSGSQILPKLLASEVPIEITDTNNKDQSIIDCSNKSVGNKKRRQAITKGDICVENGVNETKKVDIVLIDDNEMFVSSLAMFLENQGKIVDKYHSPSKFLDKISQYSKNTMIFMDNDLQSSMNGIELAKQLHEKGYTRLYLLSGKDFEEKQTPDYLTTVIKTDTDKIYRLVK
ncbi:MAG TPA: hypothetical protein DEG23_03035, partial [Coxiellaceae bacterium]|nr:hypothetical protein [Coxiellaceae bacterium]